MGRSATCLYLGIVAALLACQAAQIIQTVDIVQGEALRQSDVSCRGDS